MKRQALPTKRQPAPQSLMKKLRAVTGRKKRQSVAATADPDDFVDDGSSKISRNLTVIFLVHIVAIVLWFTHEKFFAVADGAPVAAAAANAPAAAPVAAPARLTSGEQGYVVRRGDNYSTIALGHGVTEAALREANGNRPVNSGTLLRIPPREIRAGLPPEVAAIDTNTAARDAALAGDGQPPVATLVSPQDSGLVDAVPAGSAAPPRAQMVRPNTTHPGATAAASGSTYVVQPGDTVWRISSRFNVSQDALMRANKITDPTKMRVGMTLVIP